VWINYIERVSLNAGSVVTDHSLVGACWCLMIFSTQKTATSRVNGKMKGKKEAKNETRGSEKKRSI